MADLNGTVSGGQKITGTVEPQAQKLRGAIRLSGGGGGVTDVWQNGESVLDGTIGKVTVPTNTSDLTNDSGFITTETDPVFGASPAKNITASNISTWNGKQDALVSGANIKTVNSTSLLGSGNVAVQETLVSGTNIKTINGNDLLGSGNIVIQGGGGSTVSYTQTQTSGNELGTITIDGTSSKIYSPTETDPVYSASPAAGITSANISAWNGMAPKDWVSYNNTTLQNAVLLDANSPTGIFASSNGWHADTTNYPTYFTNEYGAIITVPYWRGTGLDDAMQLFFDENGNASCRKNESGTWKSWTSIGGAGADVTQVSITVANWNATTTCTKSVTGVTTSNSVIVSPAPASIADYVSAGVYCSAQGSGTLTFTASSTPTADLVVNVMVVG